MDHNIERFISYCKIDTQSDHESESVPSAAKELNLTKVLLAELTAFGLKASINEFGILYAFLPGEKKLDVIGLAAHVDTAEEVTGEGCSPRYISKYDGGEIVLNEHYKMGPSDFSTLAEHKGDDLVVTDGSTLLGADDKAGVAIIMAAIEYFVKNPEIKHHPLALCFTPDEEIGRGPDHFDAKTFGAAYAYTLDGGVYDEIAIENFNAAAAKVVIEGVSIHPGEAKGKMVNAAELAGKFDQLLPAQKKPQFTAGREGFNHLVEIKGNCDKAELSYIIRNHDAKKLEEQKGEFLLAEKKLRSRYPSAKISVTITEQYRNMKEIFDKDPRAVEHIEKTFAKLGLKAVYDPIRGGTDGATFSFKGCPTPNLGTGSYNHHGRFEYLSVGEFRKMIQIVETLAIIE